jgi:hypothetical protein
MDNLCAILIGYAYVRGYLVRCIPTDLRFVGGWVGVYAYIYMYTCMHAYIHTYIRTPALTNDIIVWFERVGHYCLHRKLLFTQDIIVYIGHYCLV